MTQDQFECKKNIHKPDLHSFTIAIPGGIAFFELDTFGERLRNLLAVRGMTQQQLAEKADLHPCAVSLYCADKRKPYAQQLVRLAETLDTTTDYLLRGIVTAPVKHSYWIMLSRHSAVCYLCGAVERTNGEDQTMEGHQFRAQKHYCAHCGAVMDGVVQNA